MTTDLYPKVRRAAVGAGTVVGIAKGAGMVEPNMATLLVYLLTDLAVPRSALRRMLAPSVDRTFNRISVDSDTSTSDSVVALSSGLLPCPDLDAFATALETVCADLAEDVVRNGEGVRHVLRVAVRGAPDQTLARAVGKSVVNSPLVKTAACGNDPNVGRIIMAIGKHLGAYAPDLDPGRVRLRLGGRDIFADGTFRLSPEVESALVGHLKAAELYPSLPSSDGLFRPAIDYPPHEKTVDLEIDLGQGPAQTTVLGADLTHEYVTENADYRS
jgi:glutamate N-acetyltransferase / amino-acid N-acetyltransferase